MRVRARRPGVRRRGRTAPLNGSVTRADIRAVYREFSDGVDGDPPRADEFLTYLLGAILDPSHGPRTRARIAHAARRREARKREAREQLAQPPPRAAAAA